MIELIKNADESVITARKDICKTCQMFSASDNVEISILNAETGIEETIIKVTQDMCNKSNLALTGFLSMIHSSCPEGKW